MQREDLVDLKAFLTVAEEQSFTRAAAKLGTSQSALRPLPFCSPPWPPVDWICTALPEPPCSVTKPLMLALAYLAAVRKDANGGGDLTSLAEDLLPLTVPAVRRLLRLLLDARGLDQAALWRWSEWRRRHQQRARRAHGRRRAMRTTTEPRL